MGEIREREIGEGSGQNELSREPLVVRNIEAESGVIYRHGRARRFFNGTCDICRRTLLVGETPELYREPFEGGQVRVVCSVCRDGVREQGFIDAA